MKKRKILKIVLLNLIVMILCFKPVMADVGSFDTYDSGGSDWGSSGSDWESSSSDWGSSWGASSSSWDSGDYDSEGGGSILGLVWLFSTEEGKVTLLIISIIIVLTSFIKKHGERIQQRDPFYNGRKQQNVNVDAGTVYTTNVHDVSITHIHDYTVEYFTFAQCEIICLSQIVK